MQHLTEEQLVSHYYHEDESKDSLEHFRACAECQSQYETIRRVLALVTEAPVPEPAPNFEEQVWNRLRWKLGSQRRRRATWITTAAAAAALTIAFFAGLFWRGNHETSPIATVTAQGPVQQTASAAPTDHGERILLVVVGDHLDSTERMLMEVANADPQKPLTIGDESRRAGELVAENRIYRQTAQSRGNERLASVLAEIEPVLIELSHSGASLSSTEVASLQKRIDAKGLLFKVRVISARTGAAEKSSRPINADTL